MEHISKTDTFGVLLGIILISFGIIIGLSLQAIWSMCIKSWVFVSKNTKMSPGDHEKNRNLWERNSVALPQYFSDRSAFWGHMFTGGLITLIILFSINNYSAILPFSIFAFICLYFASGYKKKEINTLRSK